MSVSLASLLSRVQAAVPARDDVPSREQYEQCVKDAVEDYGARRPMQKTTDVSVVSGTDSYDLPSDFVKLIKFESVLGQAGVLNTSAGLIPVSSTFKERVMVQGGSLVISPEPTYSATRRLWYGAAHVLNSSDVYPNMSEADARIVLQHAEWGALMIQANHAAQEAWQYQLEGERVSKEKLAGELRKQATAKMAAYVNALASMGSWGIQADYDWLGR